MAEGSEMLLTVFLEHRQSMNLAEIKVLKAIDFMKERDYPPRGDA